MSTEEFIVKAKAIHHFKYDYSKTIYVNPKTEVIIICPKHGEFKQMPYNHLQGKGCLKCSYEERNISKKKSTEVFISEATSKHNNKYDYSKAEYQGSHKTVCIICPEHGEFYQTPSKHLQGQGCPMCAKTYQYDTRTFINKSQQMWGDKFRYIENTVYKGNNKPICIECVQHGSFWTTPHIHLDKRGNGGCQKCKIQKTSEMFRYDNEQFLKNIPTDIANKYDFSKCAYVKSNTPITLICHEKDKFGREHGEFSITPNSLLNGCGCSKCSKVYKRSQEEFIRDCELVHGSKYDYSKIEYVDVKTKICIICPEHGEFWQTPSAHLYGSGCPQCSMSHLENKVSECLKRNNIQFIYENNINGILGRKTCDFYLPDYNIAIECQGGQHFRGGFNKNDKKKAYQIHQKVLKRDIVKYKTLTKNNINILYYLSIEDVNDKIFTQKKYKNIYKRDNVFFGDKELINKIKSFLF